MWSYVRYLLLFWKTYNRYILILTPALYLLYLMDYPLNQQSHL